MIVIGNGRTQGPPLQNPMLFFHSNQNIRWNMKEIDAEDLIGCCGLFCGLCNKFQSKAPSRCIGCKKGEQHSWCSIWNCCVKKHGFETCAECEELFKCTIFTRRKVSEWIPAADNLRQIKKGGLKNWLQNQRERQNMVELLLQEYNDGRSMTYHCKVCSRMSLNLISMAIKESNEKYITKIIDHSDIKLKVKIFKEIINNIAIKSQINLS